MNADALRNNWRDIGTIYRYVWQCILSDFLGWDEARIEAWSDQFEPDLSDEYSWLFHESETFYVAPLLIPNDIGERLSLIEYRDLRLWIGGLIFPQRYEARSPEGLISYDWAAAKRRVEEFMDQLRAELNRGTTPDGLAADKPP